MKEEDLVKTSVFWMLNKIPRSLRSVIWGQTSVKATAGWYCFSPRVFWISNAQHQVYSVTKPSPRWFSCHHLP